MYYAEKGGQLYECCIDALGWHVGGIVAATTVNINLARFREQCLQGPIVESCVFINGS